jgi:hypothetical protein
MGSGATRQKDEPVRVQTADFEGTGQGPDSELGQSGTDVPLTVPLARIDEELARTVDVGDAVAIDSADRPIEVTYRSRYLGIVANTDSRAVVERGSTRGTITRIDLHPTQIWVGVR